MSAKLGPLMHQLITGSLDIGEAMKDFAVDVAKELGPAMQKAGAKIQEVAKPVIDEMAAFGKTVSEDAAAGFNNANFLETAGNIIGDEASNFNNPFSNMKLDSLDSLNLNLKRPKKQLDEMAAAVPAIAVETPAAVKQIDEVGKAAEKTKKDVEKPMKMNLDMTGVELGSAEAMDKVRKHSLKMGESLFGGKNKTTAVAAKTGAAETKGATHQERVENLLGKIAANTSTRNGNVTNLKVAAV